MTFPRSASVLGEDLPVRCPVCGIFTTAKTHALRITGPVEAWLNGGEFGPADWERAALAMAFRHGQFGDYCVFDDVWIDREVKVMSARLLHYRASQMVSPREAAVA